ncbi:hypothetical protein Tco_0755207 [Tanacetum coccineum]
MSGQQPQQNSLQSHTQVVYRCLILSWPLRSSGAQAPECNTGHGLRDGLGHGLGQRDKAWCRFNEKAWQGSTDNPAASDEEVEGPMKDQPLSADASPTALSPGYIADSDPEEDKEDPEEDPTDHPADG